MIDNFLNFSFGILKRFWYLVACLITVGGIISIIGYNFSDKTDQDWFRLGCLAIFMPLPFARIIHLTSHWIIWGKIK